MSPCWAASPNIANRMAVGWTVPDANPRKRLPSESVQYVGKVHLLLVGCRAHWFSSGMYESGLADLFAGTAIPRSPIRRQVLYRCHRQWGLLPFDLPGSNCEGKERPLFSQRGCRRRSRISSMSTMPAGEFARNTGVDGNFHHGFTGPPPDR